MPLIDDNNVISYIDISESKPTCYLQQNMIELTQGINKQMVEIPTLIEKHKPKRELFNSPAN